MSGEPATIENAAPVALSLPDITIRKALLFLTLTVCIVGITPAQVTQTPSPVIQFKGKAHDPDHFGVAGVGVAGVSVLIERDGMK